MDFDGFSVGLKGCSFDFCFVFVFFFIISTVEIATHRLLQGTVGSPWILFTGPNPDDLMGACYTDGDGNFDLQGNSYELSTIDPEVRIYHDCNDNGRACIIHVLMIQIKK